MKSRSFGLPFLPIQIIICFLIHPFIGWATIFGASVIFVLPGLLMIGWWAQVPFWPTFGACAIGGVLLHGLQKFRRVILLALGVEGELRIEPRTRDAAGHVEGIGERWSHILQQPHVEISDRQQFEHLHRVSTGLLQPYFFSL